MKTQLILMTLLLFSIFCCTSSCKKDSTEETTTSLAGLIKTVVTGHDSTFYYYRTDRLLDHTISNGVTTSYSYNTGYITVNSSYPKYYLDGNSLVVTETFLYDYYHPYEYSNHLEYNAGHFRTRYVLSSPGGEYGEIHYFYNNENQDSVREELGPPAVVPGIYDRQFFTYYPDKTNSITYANFGQPYYGKSNANPVKTKTTIRYLTAEDTLVDSYQYDYDNMGRIVQKIHISPTLIPDTTWYTYY
jgi:hypothetical protein